jgi:hypothetical protein
MERASDRKVKMERYCLTGQSPQQAVAPTEEVVVVVVVVVVYPMPFLRDTL